jgi:hypothetical protein
MAIGRLAAQTVDEVNSAIDKIILYEESYLEPQPWHNNVLFVADNTDSGGDFCGANEAARPLLPDEINQVHLCLEPDPITATVTVTDVQDIRVAMAEWVNADGVSILNYRGHGGVPFWGGYPMYFLSLDDQGWWTNFGQPPVILSLDCLDANFAFPGYPSLAETFLGQPGTGSVAHWSSTGLGLTTEHSILQRGFYEGLYGQDLNRMGDVVNYAKMYYAAAWADESELYSFTLHGDPAMLVLGPERQEVFLPALMSTN